MPFLNAVTFPKEYDDIEEKDGCGMHFTMIRRDVLEALEPPYFVTGSETGAGEDYYFCQQAQKAGFKIHWDKSVYTGHSSGENYDHGLVQFLWIDKLVNGVYEIADIVV